MSAVTVRNLTFAYGEKPILRKVSLSVKKGEFFVIIGPNGAGKTSLLKAIAGFAESTGSRVEIFGRPIAAYSRRQLAKVMAMVPQQIPIDFPFTVADTVLMGRSPHLGLLGVERDKDLRIAKQAMEFTEVVHLADRRLDQVSGGERQRVFIARAICQQSGIILLDEPTTALDPAHQLKIMDLMERFRRERQTTVIMISHDLNLASMYGDRLLLIKEGMIEKIGPPGDVLTREQLTRSYGCTLLVDKNPLTSRPRVTPAPEKYRSATPSRTLGTF